MAKGLFFEMRLLAVLSLVASAVFVWTRNLPTWKQRAAWFILSFVVIVFALFVLRDTVYSVFQNRLF